MQTIVHRTEKASFWERLGAYLIDGVLLAVVFLLVWLVFWVLSMPMYVSEAYTPRAGVGSIPMRVLAEVFSFVYRLSTEWTMDGQTLGKKVLGIRVVKADGSPADGQTLVVRELMFVALLAIPMVSLLVYIANIVLVAGTEKRQALHDLIANSVVVKA